MTTEMKSDLLRVREQVENELGRMRERLDEVGRKVDHITDRMEGFSSVSSGEDHSHEWIDVTGAEHDRRTYICECGAEKTEPIEDPLHD